MSNKSITVSVSEDQVIQATHEMCVESLPPEHFEAWEKIASILARTRKGVTFPVTVDQKDAPEVTGEPVQEEDRLEMHKRLGRMDKYKVTKRDGRPVDDGADYFVLRLDYGGSDLKHINACRHAIITYATQICRHLPALSAELLTRYNYMLEPTQDCRTALTFVLPEPFMVGMSVTIPGFGTLQKMS